MKSLDKLTKSADSEFTSTVVDTVMMMTRIIRCEMNRHKPVELTMAQFRTMRIIHRHPDISLSHLAEHLGITNASTSTLIDGMVKSGMVTREYSAEDRRRIMIKLTELGMEIFHTAVQATHERLVALLTTLDTDERDTVTQAMEILRTVLDNHTDKKGDSNV